MENKLDCVKKSFEIHVDMLQTNILVVVGDRSDVPSEFELETEVPTIPEKYQGKLGFGKYQTKGICRTKCSIYKDKMYRLIWVDGYISNDEIWCTLMHEYEHAVDETMRCTKMEKDHEPRAYMLSYLTRCSLEFMKELYGIK